MEQALSFEANFNHVIKYNTKVKVAGNSVEFRRYAVPISGILKGAEGKKPIQFENVTRDKTEAEKEYKYYANLRQTRQRVFDLINANVRNNIDYAGNHQRIKFMTLTFADAVKIESIDHAWAELQDFLKRLSYHFFKVNKNVIKYVCTWELQESGRIHFHLLVFNMPFISNREKDGYPLQTIWGNGFVGINALKRKNGKNIDLDKIAGYIVKYMTKTTKRVGDKIVLDSEKNVYTYENYKAFNLLGAKKYTASRGLNKPQIFKYFMSAEEFKSYIKKIKTQKGFKKNRKGNYLDARTMDMKNPSMDEGFFFNRIWIAQGALRRDFLEAFEIINLFNQGLYKTIRKIKFLDHDLKKRENSLDYQQMRLCRAVLL